MKVESIINEQGESQESAPHPKQILKVNTPYTVQKGELIRLKPNSEGTDET